MTSVKDSEYLLNQYIYARWKYRCAELTMQDAEYNLLEDKIKELYPTSIYLTRGWSEDPCPVEILIENGRDDLIKDLTFTYKTESIPSFRSWESLKNHCGNLNEEARLSYKHDGWNIQNNYYNCQAVGANTRGRDTTPQESSSLLGIIPNIITLPGKVKIFGELTIPDNKWEEFKRITGLSDQRAAVSGALARDLAEYSVFHAFNYTTQNGDKQMNEDRYSVLRSWGFNVPGFLMVHTYQELVNGIHMLSKMYPKYGYHADGLVLETSRYQIAIRLDTWEESDTRSYVLTDSSKSYSEETTPYGRSIVLNIRPTMCEGKKISQLAITNLNRIEKFNLRPGAPVVFTLRSGANPVFSETGTVILHNELDGEWEEYRTLVDQGD